MLFLRDFHAIARELAIDGRHQGARRGKVGFALLGLEVGLGPRVVADGLVGLSALKERRGTIVPESAFDSSAAVHDTMRTDGASVAVVRQETLGESMARAASSGVLCAYDGNATAVKAVTSSSTRLRMRFAMQRE